MVLAQRYEPFRSIYLLDEPRKFSTIKLEWEILERIQRWPEQTNTCLSADMELRQYIETLSPIPGISKQGWTSPTNMKVEAVIATFLAYLE